MRAQWRFGSVGVCSAQGETKFIAEGVDEQQRAISGEL